MRKFVFVLLTLLFILPVSAQDARVKDGYWVTDAFLLDCDRPACQRPPTLALCDTKHAVRYELNRYSLRRSFIPYKGKRYMAQVPIADTCPPLRRNVDYLLWQDIPLVEPIR
ncbi:MAG: hypothetical protein K8L99_15060 [Anaerolineae bacterium]|nr:hypothetical protein [Anaerolineae bacterium]